MAENYLITGYWGVPHVTSENDRGINAAIFGAGRFVLPVGEQFRAEYIGNNTVRIYDGKLIDNGAVAGIPAGEYVDLLIHEAGQGMTRNDLIVFQYAQDPSTLIESGVFMVLSGEETSGTATDPALTQEDLLTNEATLDQMALWRVPVSGTVISTPVQLFGVTKNMINAGASIVEATSSDGETYSATVPGITELYAGLEIVIIPQMESTSETITLDVNGLGAKNVRLPLSSNTTTLVMPENPNYYTAGRPVKLRYDATWLNNRGAWVVAERQRTSANDLYGTVPVENGGTGADNAAEALANLGAAPSGYGLGTGAPYGSAVDSIFNGGFYRWDVAKDSAPFSNASMIVIPRAKDTSAGQIAFGHAGNTKGVLAMRAVTSTSANEWDWVNPPMTIGNEYRTTERYNGNPVYTQLVNFGTLPNKTTKAVTVLNSGVKVSKIIGISGYILHSGGSTHVDLSAHPSVRQSMELQDTGMTLNLITDADMSAWSAVIQIKYI